MKKPINQAKLFYLSGILTFFTSFVFYLFTLAPSVTLEDSGELIAAAYNLGIPHQPGYPLFAMLGKLFSLLPFGSIAFRLNLMSAFFSALGAVMICWSVIFLVENSTLNSKKSKKSRELQFEWHKYAAGISAGLFMAFSFEVWEQSLITEVYGLHAFFTGLFLLLYIRFKRQKEENHKRKYFIALLLVTGLALTNHSTSIFLVPLLLLDLLITDSRFLFRVKTITRGILFFVIGLLPLLYLPIASSFDPVIDWGNPENLTNFLRTVTRHQYTGIEQDGVKFMSELRFFFSELLVHQWGPVFLALLIPAYVFLFKRNRNFLYFSLFFLFLATVVITYVADFDVRGNDFNAQLNRVLVTVFYIPAYIMTSLLMGLGLYYLCSLIKNRPLLTLAAISLLLLPLINIFKNYQKVDMHDFRLADRFTENLFMDMPDGALLVANIDYIYFPTLYYQYVLHQRPDLVILDQELLRRSWYIEMLSHNYPGLIERSSTEVDRFLASLKPFEDGESYDGNKIQRDYIGMINSFIDNAFRNGEAVYYTIIPPPEILREYRIESLVSSFRLYQEPSQAPFQYEKLLLGDFKKVGDDEIFFSRFLRDYYMELLVIRARDMESLGRLGEARKYYHQVLEFNSKKSPLMDFAKMKLEELQLTQ
jgi:hypothetical protein